jgi:hypothetical protein
MLYQRIVSDMKIWHCISNNGRRLNPFPSFGVVSLVLVPTLTAVGAIAALVTEATILVEKEA